MSTKLSLTMFVCFLGLILCNRSFSQQTGSANLFIELPQSVTLTPSAAGNSSLSNENEITTGEHSRYRSFDGTNNNISRNSRRNWGSANIPLVREMPAAYGPNNSLGGRNRPSAREVSNVVVSEPITIFNDRNVSTVFYFWAQFLDHEITLTPTGNESEPIELPEDEELFTEPIPFTRSAVFPGTGTGAHPVREQFNLNTAWIDGSVVYGSDAARAKWIRSFRHGKLKTSAGNLLPFNTIDGQQSSAIDPNAPGMANDGNKTIKTFVAGDVRASEHPVLASLHTLFMREHNRICDRLVARGQRNDEENYQTARKIVGALLQKITYYDALPALGISVRPYRGYDDDVRPDLVQVFATAAFRLGHSMVADEVLLFDNDCEAMDPEAMELDELFWNPQLVVDMKPEAFLKGFAAHTQYETNILINDVLRNLLFGDPASPVRFGVDLAALNIQRGRDHGLPDYNTVRKFYGIRGATRFSDINRLDSLARNLRSLYRSIDNVDLWTGVLAEDRIPGTSIGRLAHEIQRTQFDKLRTGDFYYFENDPNLSDRDRSLVWNSTLADIIKRNTAITNLQDNIFFVEACPGFTPTPARLAAVVNTTDKKEMSPRVFPNPVDRTVNVVLDDTNQSGVIELYGVNGVLVKTIITRPDQKEVQIDVSDLPKGINMLKIVKGKTVHFKLLKL